MSVPFVCPVSVPSSASPVVSLKYVLERCFVSPVCHVSPRLFITCPSVMLMCLCLSLSVHITSCFILTVLRLVFCVQFYFPSCSLIDSVHLHLYFPAVSYSLITSYVFKPYVFLSSLLSSATWICCLIRIKVCLCLFKPILGPNSPKP